MNDSEFIEYVKHELFTANKSILLSGDTGVVFEGEDTLVNGYWDDSKGVLAVAMGKSRDEWFPVLVHEFCHFLQFREKWETPENEDLRNHFWFCLEPNRKRTKKVRLGKEATQLLEWDCERRSLELINKFNLDLDPKKYARNANSYIYFYEVVWRYRKWYEIGNEPYNNPVILERMPDYLDDKYLTVSDEIVELIARETRVKDL